MSGRRPFPHSRLSRHQVKVKFVLVGAWNTLFGYGVFCLLDTLFPPVIPTRYLAYMSALVISNALAIVNAFVFHKYITFRSGIRGWEIVPEFMRFTLTYAATFCLSLVLMPLLVEIFQVHTKLAAGMILVVCTGVSYLGHSRFSFNAYRTGFSGRRMT